LELADEPSAAAFLVRAGSARERELLEAHSMVKNSLAAESSRPTEVALGEEVFNLIEKSQTRYEEVDTKLRKVHTKLEEVQGRFHRIKETHREWEQASLLNLIRYRYGDHVKRILATLRKVTKRG
jgi:hypothetical protein